MSDYPMEDLPTAQMSYRKLLADRDSKTITREQFSEMLTRLHAKWGARIFGRRYGMPADTGKYQRSR